MAEFPVSFSLVDAYGRPVGKQYTVEALDHVTALTEAGNFAADLAAITEARILWYVVGQRVTYTDVVDVGANRDEGVTFSVRKADNEKAVVKVPAPINSILNNDGTVDLTDAAVSAFFANFLSGVFRVSDHEIMTELIAGKLDK